MKIHIVTCLSMIGYLGCGLSQLDPHPYAGTLPPKVGLDMSGTFALSPAGELTLALRDGCQVERSSTRGTTLLPCSAAERDAIRVMAVAPWRAESRGTWIDAKHVVFHVDWSAANIEVLADDATTSAARPWAVSGSVWRPSAEDARRIVGLVGEATRTETELVSGGEAPSLEVSALELEGGALRAGHGATLVVHLVNRGPGVAYRVVATTRSSVQALHGRRLELGAIQPGAEKQRRVRLEVPSGETARDAMVVLALAEGNGFAPVSASRRWPVAAAAAELTARCGIAPQPTPRVEISAGERVTVRCTVGNDGAVPATVTVEVAMNGNVLGKSRVQEVRAHARGTFEVQIATPRDLAINTTAQLTVTARDARLGRPAQDTIAALVRKPKLCAVGGLTRAQYDAKIAELRSAVAAGDMTQAQLDRYDAELVGCLP